MRFNSYAPHHFRHFDTAFHYQNEDQVGKAINNAISSKKVSREDIFVTSKLADHHKTPGFIATAVEAQLKALNLEYIDLYLIHSPWSLVPSDDIWERVNLELI